MARRQRRHPRPLRKAAEDRTKSPMEDFQSYPLVRRPPGPSSPELRRRGGGGGGCEEKRLTFLKEERRSWLG